MQVTNIQRFSLDDGPGIRTTVFLADCNMRCLWCHNPENLKKDMIRYERIDETNVKEIHNSRSMSVEEIADIVGKDKHYYIKSGGGITVSGGEPVCQTAELKYLLKSCKENKIHTAIETALNYEYSDLESLFPYVDLIIADCKAVTENVHVACTGVTNHKVLSNIGRLSDDKKRVWIRIPVVPNVNITLEEIQYIAEFLGDKNIERIELLPYHKMGINKYELWGMEYKLPEAKVPSRKYMERCYEILAKTCNHVVKPEENAR